MRIKGGRILSGLLIILVVIVVYTFWDNNRIKIVEQDIAIEDLPQQFEEFQILQVTDLHEKQFGKDQRKLVKAINAIEYDVLVFTGDMLDDTQSSNFTSFYSVLDGIDNKEHILYVPGNADPYSYNTEPVFGKSEFINGLEDRGVTFLESIETVSIDSANLHFVDFELSIAKDEKFVGKNTGIVKPPYSSDASYRKYQQQLWEELTVLNEFNNSDIVIALNHYPIVDNRIEFIMKDPNRVWRDYDLIMAGHYHGGQFRIPFLGALFVPEAWYEPNSFFPPTDRVKGLWEYKDTQQYVSAGLGSSDAIPLLKFRLFNPPEINVLKLIRK
ncbi:metallophosphoesterase [Virgibacillus sp. C22-A2]|uniref:Metallophosphoesterase n=1 Tax=Virgibacillus tibetensis TaxID=3042313 RepID=A0ABU6KFV4_9BACI|nr:metallophosphoesterase [Virgibacillus sp. C22-A2]